jgi:flagellar operon protein (TIGR03826 family)
MVSRLSNCPKCGKLFIRVREICDDCYEKQEEDYQKVSSYLWDHPGCNIQELSNATGVSVSQIRQFILANRIIISQFKNLSYPCDTCGKMIKEGKTCPSCLKKIIELASKVEKEKQTKKNERSSSYKIHQ